ncbi:hypothetical protein F2Q68_00022845 [Brassica cretica]|uniref:Cyclin N-terminal domain-containing protein n=2 Tax=Brassica cretica TaxID=69181 RepID=A0ABQ7DCV4_BRACR|nr:hypothetical protein F2Q68_00022845 [Brassica cretica]KAF3569088.1 hypothetical protein DY000_02019111 [Brassica cretica]
MVLTVHVSQQEEESRIRVQKDVTPNMRGVLVDWLVEVAEEYKLLSDTRYLTVSYIDRFLSLQTINRQKLQLLGVFFYAFCLKSMNFLWTWCSVFYAGGGDCKISIGAFNSLSDYATQALGSVSDPRYLKLGNEEPRLETKFFNENNYSEMPMLQLHKEIGDFCEFLLPTRREKAQRDNS